MTTHQNEPIGPRRTETPHRGAPEIRADATAEDMAAEIRRQFPEGYRATPLSLAKALAGGQVPGPRTLHLLPTALQLEVDAGRMRWTWQNEGAAWRVLYVEVIRRPTEAPTEVLARQAAAGSPRLAEVLEAARAPLNIGQRRYHPAGWVERTRGGFFRAGHDRSGISTGPYATEEMATAWLTTTLQDGTSGSQK